MMKTGLFVGSFDPFTIGHDNIVRRAVDLFDRLVIGVGDNPGKQCMFSLEERVRAIRELYADDPRIEVTSYSDFTIDLAQRVGARYIVKGVRSVTDFEYERIQNDFNQRLGGIETVLLYADPTMTSISSSAVRQLIHFHKDADWMIPKKK